VSDAEIVQLMSIYEGSDAARRVGLVGELRVSLHAADTNATGILSFSEWARIAQLSWQSLSRSERNAPSPNPLMTEIRRREGVPASYASRPGSRTMMQSRDGFLRCSEATYVLKLGGLFLRQQCSVGTRGM
jgi:hypothetical protein